MHLLNSFNDRRANKRALKAANGPSLAPKNYQPDTAGRTAVSDTAEWDFDSLPDRGKAYNKAAITVSNNE